METAFSQALEIWSKMALVDPLITSVWSAQGSLVKKVNFLEPSSLTWTLEQYPNSSLRGVLMEVIYLAFNNLANLNNSNLEGHLIVIKPYLSKKCWQRSEIGPPTRTALTPKFTIDFTNFSARISSDLVKSSNYLADSNRTVPLVSPDSSTNGQRKTAKVAFSRISGDLPSGARESANPGKIKLSSTLAPITLTTLKLSESNLCYYSTMP